MLFQVVVIIVYFVLTLAIGLRVARHQKKSADYFGSQLGVSAIVFASAGEWLGGTATTGVAEYGFLYGISGAFYTIANGIGVLFLALFFAGIYRRIGRLTIPGIIEHVFGVRAELISSIILVLVMWTVGLSQMIAAGKFGQALLGLDFRLCVVVFALIFVLYTMPGGMKAVSTTNTLHLFVMYGGVIFTVIYMLVRLGGISGLTAGIHALEQAEGGSFFSPTAIGFPKISSWILASLLGACTAQAGIQPVLAAKDVPTAKRACFYTALVAAPFGLLTAMLGIIARVQAFQGTLFDSSGAILTDGKMALTSVMLSLPTSISGLVLAAELAAILSTASPIILAAGTMLTKDLYQMQFHRNASDRELLVVSRIMTAVSGAICCGGAIALVNRSRVLDLVYTAYSLRGALFVVLIYGFFWKRANSRAACVSMLLTCAAAVFWVAFKSCTGSYPIAAGFTETYAAILTALITMPVFSVLYNRMDRNRGVLQ